MKKQFLATMLVLGLSLAPLGVQAAENPFLTPPKNMRSTGGAMQINSTGAPGIPAPPAFGEEVVMQEDITHPAAMPLATTTPATGSNTWLTLAIGMMLLALGGFFGFRYHRKN